MKKFFLLIVLLLIYTPYKVYGITDEFKNIIEQVGIPRYNVKNQEINEDIYYTYNLFVYASPTSVVTSEQRWKSLSNGKWQYNGGAYRGGGTPGEYAVLGTDYSSRLVYNYYFPLDRVTSTPIINWTFLDIQGALASWNNAYSIYSKEQIDYAKQAKWWFQNIAGGANNPYDQREYDLNAITVGLGKCRLETPATWKTKGSIFTNRRTESGGIAWANFAIEPMSANAKVTSNIPISNKNYTLSSNEDNIMIPIEFGATISELSEYAKLEHIKEVTSELYVNEKQVSKISGSKIASVGNKYMLVITRNLFPQNRQYQIKLKVYSYVKTEFSADGLLQDSKEVTLTVKVEEKKIQPIISNEMKILGKRFSNWVVSPLAQNVDTIKNSSLGISEAGRVIAVKGNLNLKDVTINEIEQLQVFLNDRITNSFEVIKSASSCIALKLQLPDDLEATMYGIKSLRQESHNYFLINSADILKRKKAPHILEIKYIVRSKAYSEKLKFDTIDHYVSNLNTSIIDSLSITKRGNEIKLEEWLNKI